MTRPNFVTAIIRNEQNHILMIYVQGNSDSQPYWSLPGGRVEKGESAEEALIREVLEETGLSVLKMGIIAYQTQMQFNDTHSQAVVYEITEWQGEPNPDDPEDEILDVRWIPYEQSIRYLSKIDYLPMSEPPIAYLSKTAHAGKIWQYRLDENGAHWLRNQ